MQPNYIFHLFMKRLLSFILVSGITFNVYSQRLLSLDSCRSLAIENNKEIRIAQEKINAAHYQKKAAFTNYLPKFDIIGTYMRTQKEVSLLSDEQKHSIGNIGTTAGNQLQQQFQQLQHILEGNPMLAPILKPLQSIVPGMIQGVTNGLNGAGQGFVDALRTDTRNMFAGTLSLTQPLYMGGKIVAYNKITRYAEQLAQNQHATGMEDIILSTDQAYWQVISLENKRKLAESYVNLLKTLDSDIEKMINEGVATKSDGLSVKVKLNEAEVTLTKVENGLSLSRMVLCQICGIPLNTDIALTDENIENLTLPETFTESNVDIALANRKELKSLELATKIYNQKVNIARSEFLPSIALTANYAVTNPSLVNGFENKFRGMFAAGVVLKVPVFHWGEGIYKVKAAKAEANIAKYQLADVREKVELQVTQNSYKVNEAIKQLAMAEQNMDKAEENLRFATLGFKEGVIPTSNVLEAQTAWLSAKSGRIDAQIDMKMSELYLKKSMGTLK